ncbi:SUMF1/EgtB/PvdO family nonheme iron enzyme [Moorena bouillonii]|uniref:Uncharacterized protein n=1 Tax=Moorena bouillonii PNG TaxID=568701 RepID=A0A1U7MW04_9CYAN|nr:SUMF1/EgtB/PvdO family nonheme iron enzyme [Moorena bouillonii]OLT57873.1 hypothetical protein BJP37_01250 [Moorena bouillonii PNG]
MNAGHTPGYLLKQINEALCSAFPDKTELEMMVRYALNINLNEVASGGNLKEIVDRLIIHCQASNKLDKLIDRALNYNPDNLQLKAIQENFKITTSVVEILRPLEKRFIKQMQHAYRDCCADKLEYSEYQLPDSFYDILKQLDEISHPTDDEKNIVKFVDYLLVNVKVSKSKADQLKQWLDRNANNVSDLLYKTLEIKPPREDIKPPPDPIVDRNFQGCNYFSRADFLKICLITMPIVLLVDYLTNKQKGLKYFSFEVVTVNRRGEIINTENKQASYFTEDLGNGVDLDMVSIPEGSFLMGSPESEKGSDGNERPQHRVTVKPFFLGKYQVTQAQWRAVVENLPKVNQDLNPDPSYFKGEKRPVEGVSWYDAMEFCDRLCEHTGKKYKLPSEAEWEYACRAETITPFHYGETITSKLANYGASDTYAEEAEGVDRGKTTPVGHFPYPNSFGLYDMHGNVWEWCADPSHPNYEGAPIDGSIWTKHDNHTNYIMRGGSCFFNSEFCRSAFRNNYYARAHSYFDIGFRVARGVG